MKWVLAGLDSCEDILTAKDSNTKLYPRDTYKLGMSNSEPYYIRKLKKTELSCSNYEMMETWINVMKQT